MCAYIFTCKIFSLFLCKQFFFHGFLTKQVLYYTVMDTDMSSVEYPPCLTLADISFKPLEAAVTHETLECTTQHF